MALPPRSCGPSTQPSMVTSVAWGRWDAPNGQRLFRAFLVSRWAITNSCYQIVAALSGTRAAEALRDLATGTFTSLSVLAMLLSLVAPVAGHQALSRADQTRPTNKVTPPRWPVRGRNPQNVAKRMLAHTLAGGDTDGRRPKSTAQRESLPSIFADIDVRDLAVDHQRPATRIVLANSKVIHAVPLAPYSHSLLGYVALTMERGANNHLPIGFANQLRWDHNGSLPRRLKFLHPTLIVHPERTSVATTIEREVITGASASPNDWRLSLVVPRKGATFVELVELDEQADSTITPSTVPTRVNEPVFEQDLPTAVRHRQMLELALAEHLSDQASGSN